ncbi:hypothetical protein GZ77_15830 [Endozoicomonas montiporae]|uniref:Uncharacterized protein n=2 Tax=Endozoicomonas montiporae TaxID=1027273 RepID=A0A081N5N4_9GAMM|nr:hypothetical protein EZMO1_3353 [Endozoicomonas montiporae CL-33]KEQ13757.1 hypothetical protein GZ77_15830 [Endozoicomonas montiporae]
MLHWFITMNDTGNQKREIKKTCVEFYKMDKQSAISMVSMIRVNDNKKLWKTHMKVYSYQTCNLAAIPIIVTKPCLPRLQCRDANFTIAA